MKIQCDFCNKQHASFFCTADEAALCDGCDHRVHHANKLASKHQRFSLNHPSPKHFPLCDICLERRAFVFCQQDRAILCKECDLPIHAANEHTKNHDRFLLTGIKLSPSPTLYSSPSPSQPSNSNQPQTQTQTQTQSCAKKNHPLLLDSSHHHPPSTASVPPPTINKSSSSGGILPTNEETGSTSSIAEYLINTIPGWQFEDFFDSASVPFAAFSNSKNGDMLSVHDYDIEGNLVSMGGNGLWVPQAPSSLYSSQMCQQNGYRETKKLAATSRSRLPDDNFIVPQMSPPNIATNKRSRLLW